MTEPQPRPALPDEPCHVAPHAGWSDLEAWVWQEIGSGRVADINQKLGRTGDPKKSEDWGPDRRLSSAFLETILLHNPWRGAILRQGVLIVGALFSETIDLRRAELSRLLSLGSCRFEAPVLCSGLRTPWDLSLQRSALTHVITLDSARIGGSLFLRDHSTFTSIVLRGAEIQRQLTLADASVSKTLDLQLIRIGSSLFMSGGNFTDVLCYKARIEGELHLALGSVQGKLDIQAVVIDSDVLLQGGKFQEILLGGARVGGQVRLDSVKAARIEMVLSDVRGSVFIQKHPELSNCPELETIDMSGCRIGEQLILDDAKVTRALDMRSISVTRDLFMREGAEFGGDVNIHGGFVGEEFSIACVIVGKLNMQSSRIGNSVLRSGEFQNKIDLTFADIQNLDLSGGRFCGLDLTNAVIAGELIIASAKYPAPIWTKDAELILRGARVDTVRDQPTAWPSTLDLSGFTYRRFAEGHDGVSIAARGRNWLTEWLGRAEPYSPQPDYQCAKMLREMGHPEMANDVLYAGRERERREAFRTGNNPHATGLTLLKWVIGYGYGRRLLCRPLGWVAAFTAVGTVALYLTGMPTNLAGSPIAPAFFSFDLLLPIIQLHEPHYRVALEGAAKYYFAFHKLMGYVLASFLIAGLAGLTK